MQSRSDEIIDLLRESGSWYIEDRGLVKSMSHYRNYRLAKYVQYQNNYSVIQAYFNEREDAHRVARRLRARGYECRVDSRCLHPLKYKEPFYSKHAADMEEYKKHCHWGDPDNHINYYGYYGSSFYHVQLTVYIYHNPMPTLTGEALVC